MLNYPTYDALKKCRFILASTSPRRLEILNELGVPNIEVIPSDFEENVSKEGISPVEYVTQTALGKIESVYGKLTSNPLETLGLGTIILLASDTIVVNQGRIFEKPASKADQLENLKSFRENPIVNVITAIHIYRLEGGKRVSRASRSVSSQLTFDSKLTDQFLEAYVESEEGLLAAGGFKIQGLGGLLWSELQGDFRNVIGLPFKDTFELLEEILK